MAFVLRVSPSVMVTDLMRDLAVGASILGNLSAFYFYAYLSLQIPIGIMMDRIGPRRLLAAAAAVCAAGCILFALSESVLMAYTGRLLIGGGAAFGYVGTLAIASQWFPVRWFAMLGGWLQMFGMTGAIGGQAPTGLLVDRFGWRATILLLGTAMACIALLSWWLVRDRTSETHRAVPLVASLRQVAGNSQTWFNAWVGFALTGPMLAFAGLWGVPYLQAEYELSRAAAAGIMSLYFIGWGITAPLTGWASDRIGRRKPFLVAGCAVLSISFVIVLTSGPLPWLLLGACLILSGAAGATMVVTFANAKELNPRAASGAAIGIVNTAVVGSGAVLQPVIGVLLDSLWEGTLRDGVPLYTASMYTTALWVLPAVTISGLLVSLLVRESFCRQVDQTYPNTN